jgi:RNase P/RNase MRP subunit POP5
MTLTKKKFRYVCIYLQHDDNLVYSNFRRDFYKRLAGLYGSIDFHKSNIRIVNLVGVSNKFLIIKCMLQNINTVLLSLYFANYPVFILSISGTIKQIKKKSMSFYLIKILNK